MARGRAAGRVTGAFQVPKPLPQTKQNGYGTQLIAPRISSLRVAYRFVCFYESVLGRPQRREAW